MSYVRTLLRRVLAAKNADLSILPEAPAAGGGDEEAPFLFLEAGIEAPKGYGHENSEILVLKSGNEAADSLLLDRIRHDDTRAIVLTDDLPLAPALAELDALAQYFTSTDSAPTINMKFRDEADFRRSFSKKLIDQALFHYSTMERLKAGVKLDFDNLAADISRSLAYVAPLFNAKAKNEYDMFVARITLEKPQWHVDFQTCNNGCVPDPRRQRAVRPLTPLGTLLAFQDSVVMENSYNYQVGEYAHAGQGLYVIRGDTVHSSQPSKKPRWVYGMSSGIP